MRFVCGYAYISPAVLENIIFTLGLGIFVWSEDIDEDRFALYVDDPNGEGSELSITAEMSEKILPIVKRYLYPFA